MRHIPLSTLTVQRRLRKGSQDGGIFIAERAFFDFVIDGQSLLEMIEGDYTSCFVRGFAQHGDAARASLLNPNTNGRVSIYICPECGDISCGAILTRVLEQDGYVVWDRLAWDNEICDAVYDGSRESFAAKELGPFRFELAAYEAAIQTAAKI
jgi:hypothetical protein